jgi:hypothetical protein
MTGEGVCSRAGHAVTLNFAERLQLIRDKLSAFRQALALSRTRLDDLRGELAAASAPKIVKK